MSIAINFRHSAIGEVLWMIPIIKSISRHHNQKIILFTRKETRIMHILKNEDYIEEIIYLPFRKGIYQIKDVINQSLILKKKKIKCIYILEEIVRPCLAAKIAGVNKIYSYGKKKQRKYLTQNKYLNDTIYNEHEYIRGIKFLKMMGIKLVNENNSINLDKIQLNKYNKKYKFYKNKIFLALQASQEFRTWPTDYFLELIKLIIKNHSKTMIFLLVDKKFSDKIKSIKSQIKKLNQNKIYSLENLFFDKIKYLIKISNLYVGCDSGPSILSDLLKTKTFVLYGATAPLPYKNKIKPIFGSKKKFIKKNLIVQAHQKKDIYMKSISPKIVYNKIKKYIN